MALRTCSSCECRRGGGHFFRGDRDVVFEDVCTSCLIATSVDHVDEERLDTRRKQIDATVRSFLNGCRVGGCRQCEHCSTDLFEHESPDWCCANGNGFPELHTSILVTHPLVTSANGVNWRPPKIRRIGDRPESLADAVAGMEPVQARCLNDAVSLVTSIVDGKGFRKWENGAPGALKLDGSFIHNWKFSLGSPFYSLLFDTTAGLSAEEARYEEESVVTTSLLRYLITHNPTYGRWADAFEDVIAGTEDVTTDTLWEKVLSLEVVLDDKPGGGVAGLIAPNETSGWAQGRTRVSINESADEVTDPRWIQRNEDLLRRWKLTLELSFPLLFPQGIAASSMQHFKHGVLRNVRNGEWPAALSLLVEELLIKMAVMEEELTALYAKQKCWKKNRLTPMDAIPAVVHGSVAFLRKHRRKLFDVMRDDGNADLFLTLTADKRWKEVEGLPEDDIVAIARVFRERLKNFLDILVEEKVLQRSILQISVSIEWQRRGTPHAHCLLWFHPSEKLISIQEIDELIRTRFTFDEVCPEVQDLCQCLMYHTCKVGRCKAHEGAACKRRFPAEAFEKSKMRSGFHVPARRPEDARNVSLEPRLLALWSGHANLLCVGGATHLTYCTKYCVKDDESGSATVGRGPNGMSSRYVAFTIRRIPKWHSGFFFCYGSR